MVQSAYSRSGSGQRPSSAWRIAVLALLVVIASAGILSTAGPTSAQVASVAHPTASFSDDFTHDTSLNTNLWAINGPVAMNFSANNCPGCSVVPLTPSFSSEGMEIANANGSSEIGAIQTVENFTVPLTVTALVRGIVSDGHPFVFGISSQNASSGVQITGNLNPNDCSAENNCGNPSTCGTPANSSIQPNQCYYGIYARAGLTGGNWKKTPALDLTPAVQVVYTLTIAVGSSGTAQFNVSAGGQVLGQSTATVGTGPFYIIVGQSEGAPVPGPGANSAVWTSVALTPTATLPSASTSSTSSSGLPSILWIILAIIVVLVVLIPLVAWNRRRRRLTVTVLDSESLSPILGAGVSAEGPRSLSGNTGPDGRVAFRDVKTGDYSIKAGAAGYQPAVPVVVSVQRTMDHTVRLDRSAPGAPKGDVVPTHPATPIPPAAGPPGGAIPPVPETPAPMVARPESPRTPATAAGSEDLEGFGGPRIREIIRTFQQKGALSPETALTAEELGLSRLFVRIMKRRRGQTRVFVEVNGRYYLDERALRDMK